MNSRYPQDKKATLEISRKLFPKICSRLQKNTLPPNSHKKIQIIMLLLSKQFRILFKTVMILLESKTSCQGKP